MTTPTRSVLVRERIPETVVPGKRLGRHLAHDSRSRLYPVRSGTIVSKKWERTLGALDQLNLGACVGNATTGALATDPFVQTLPTLNFSEKLAVDIYSAATKVDSYPGDYPPDDTGTDGLSAAAVCKTRGYISGYEHALSWDQFCAGMSTRPGIVGIQWKDGCDNPDSRGLVRWTGSVRGGHEIEADEIDLANQVVGFWNSWGPGWGLNGRFYMSFADVQAALKADGDATFFTPNTAPAPTPEPVPTPTPVAAVTRSWDDPKSVQLLDSWSAHKGWIRLASTAAAKVEWRKGH